MYPLRDNSEATSVSRLDENTCELPKIPTNLTKLDEDSMQVDHLPANQKEAADNRGDENSVQEVASTSDLQQGFVFDIAPFETRPAGSTECSETPDEQFYIAIDASTVAAIKGGTHYTLVSIDGDKLKIAADTEGNNDPSKHDAPCAFGDNKQLHLPPISSIIGSGTQITVASKSVKHDFEDLMKAAESHDEQKVMSMELSDKDSSDTYSPYSEISSSQSTKDSSSGKEKDFSFTQCAVQVTDFQTMSEEFKELTYTPLTTKNTRMKQEHTLQNCLHFDTPRGNFAPHSIHSGTPSLPLAMIGPHAPRTRALYTTTSSPGVPTPYPYKVVSSTHARGHHAHQAWTPYNQQNAVQGTQMVYTTPTAVLTTSSVNSSSTPLLPLNSSGEEVNQDSSPDFPRVPFNTPNSGEVDMGTIQRVAIVPDGQQLSQYSGHVENVRYYVPFTGREDHNQKERERRSRIKNACQKLRALVPGLNEKTDKATVFEYSAKYLTHLKTNVGGKFDKEFLESSFPYP